MYQQYSNAIRQQLNRHKAKIILATQDGALSLVDADGITRLSLATEEDVATPAFSPEGERIAFSQRQGPHFHIFVVDLASQRLTQVTKDAADHLMPIWSPTGDQLAWQTIPTARIEEGNEAEIWIGTPERTMARQLTNNLLMDVYPAWSDDGLWVVFEAGNVSGWFGIWRVAADGSLTAQPIVYEPKHSANGIPHIAGNKCVYERSDDGLHYYVAGVDIEGAARPHRLSSWRVRANPSPRFSPDGQSIAAHGYKDGSQRMQICIMDIMGRALRWIEATDDLLFLPRWSHDSGLIVAEGRVKAKLYLIEPITGEVWPIDGHGALQQQQFMRIWNYDVF